MTYSGRGKGVTALIHLPASIAEYLERLELNLVTQLHALGYPITEIDPRQRQALAMLDLPQHCEGAQAPLRLVRLVIGVYRRPALPQPIDDGHCQKVIARAEFEAARIAQRAEEKGAVLLGIGAIHAAAGMTRRRITALE